VKIRQYTAATMQEAILKIKVDLGPDAVILHTRKFKRGGFMGMFAQEMVEVLAAIDPNGEAKSDAGDGKGRQANAGARDRQAAPERRPEPVQAQAAARRPEPRMADLPGGIELGPNAANGVTWTPSERQAAPAEPMPNRMEILAGLPPEILAGLPPELAAAAREFNAREGRETAVATAVAPAPAFTAFVPPALTEPERPAAPAPTAVAEAPAAIEPTVTMMPETSKLADEVQDLKSTVSDLKSMLVTIVGQLDNQPRTPVQFPPVLQRVFERLMACDVEPSIARGLVVYLQKEQPHLETFEELVDALEMPISGLYHVAGPVSVATGEQKVVALVGPTGVGKTTTIAKLAANFALAREVDMALFTIDTYRVAAVEQLKTYGDIIGLPVETILTPQGLKEALKQHGQKDLILIDTAGRSPYNRMHLNELKSFLDFRPQRETHLVLSATTRLADLKQIVRNFTATGVDRLIFTKTDETEVVGGIISIAHETGLPVSYITTGQSVPDDIMVAEQPSLAKMLIQELKG
jgi:flagellar biosynthesis protein FlhF